MIVLTDINLKHRQQSFICHWAWEAVYMAQVFASNETLLLWFGLPFTWQQRAGTPETASVWNRVPECNLLKPQPSSRLCKLASWVPVKAVTKLMLMLAKVNAFRSSHYETQQCTQSKSDITTVYWGKLSVPVIILEVNLWLPLAQQQQEVNNFGSPGSRPMSLQTYNANYQPGMHTAAFSVVCLGADFLRHKGETFLFLAGLLSSKCGLS